MRVHFPSIDPGSRWMGVAYYRGWIVFALWYRQISIQAIERLQDDKP